MVDEAPQQFEFHLKHSKLPRKVQVHVPNSQWLSLATQETCLSGQQQND